MVLRAVTVLHAVTFSQCFNREVLSEKKMFWHADSLSRSKNREVLWIARRNVALMCGLKIFVFCLLQSFCSCPISFFPVFSLTFEVFEVLFFEEKREGFLGLKLSREEATFSHW